MANPVSLPADLNPHNDLNLIDLFARSQQLYANMPAFTCLGQTIRYGEYAQQVNALATYLQNLPNVKVGDRVAIQLPNLSQYPIAVWAAIHAGLVVVNTNPLYTEREMVQLYEDAEPKILLTLENLSETAAKVCEKCGISTLILTGIASATSIIDNANLPKAVREYTTSLEDAINSGKSASYKRPDLNLEHLVALQYTGGTTGPPKGAMLSHGNFLAHIGQINATTTDYLELGKDTVVLPLPVYHVFGFSIACMFSVSNGLHTVLIPDPRDIDSLIATLKQYPLQMFVGINSLYAGIMQHPEAKNVDFSAAKRFISGGSALTQDVAKRWEKLTQHEIYEGYGLTEVTCTLSANTTKHHRAGSAGMPMEYSEVKCIDEDGNTLPLGEAGELCAKGPQIMQGYWRKPEENAQCLSKDGWFRTGDIAIIDQDHMLRIVDRKKDMILVSGFNVYPNEIEDVATQYPHIIEAGVVGVADPKTGEAVKLYVVSNDTSLDVEQLRAFCREQLAPYKVPKIIEVVETLPKTPVGKILRRALR